MVTLEELHIYARNIYMDDPGVPYYIMNDTSIICHDCFTDNYWQIVAQYIRDDDVRASKWVVEMRRFNYVEAIWCDECGHQVRCGGFPPLTFIKGGKE